MKKAIKSAAIAALAISAITPVAASAATENVTDGIYTAEGFYSIAEFKKLSTAKKGAVLSSDNAALVVGGQALPASVILTGTDEEIDGSYISLAAYEEKYGVTFDSGKGFGEETEAGELKVESVSAINAREIAVTFNQDVDLTTGTHGALNLSNYYIGLTDAVATKSIAALDGVANGVEWEAVPGADYNKDTKKGKTVIIRSKVEAENLFDPASDLKITKGEQFTFEVRNVESAAGKGMNTQQFTVKAEDKIRPTVALGQEKVVASAIGDKITFKASEPIKAAAKSAAAALATGAKVYLDGADVTSAVKVKDSSGTVADASTLELTLAAALVEGSTHTIAFVGLQDTADNLLTPNPTEIKFTVEGTVSATAPVVQDIVQVADNAVRIIVDKAIDLDSNAGNKPQGKITVKKIDGTNDAVIDLAAGTYTGSGGVIASQFTFGADSTYSAPSATPNHKAYTLVFTDATNGLATDKLSYNTANQLIREFIVEDFYTDNATAGTHGDKKSAKYTKTLTLQKDINAPILAAKDPVSILAGGAGFKIQFTEVPFGAPIVAGLTSGNNIAVKYVKNGVTYTDELAYAASGTTAGTYVVDPTTNTIAAYLTTGTQLVDSTDKVLSGASYSITLKDNIVNDGAANATGDKLDPARAHKFVGTTVTYTTPGSGSDYSVPQTSQADVRVVGDNTFEFEIHGKDIQASTVTNKANYSFDGAALPEGTTVEFVQRGTASAPTYFGVITLAKNSIKYDGNYKLTVKDIATSTGYKMLLTNLTLAGKDNTAPTLETAKVTSSNSIELTFSENLAAIASTSAANNNFKVIIGGVTYSVATVTDTVVNDKVLEITVAGNFDIDAAGTVQVVLDVNGNTQITDNSTLNNKAGNGSVVTTTK